MPSRRSVLGNVLPLAAGLGTGCLGTTGETPADGEFEGPARLVKSIGGIKVAVWNAVARNAAIYRSGMGSDGVLAPEASQFVVASVQSGGASPDATGPPEYRDFTLEVGTDSFGPTRLTDRPAGGLTRSVAGNGDSRYDHFATSSARTGWMAFEVPAPVQASGAAIRLDYGYGTRRWPLDDSLVQSLSERAASFELRSFTGRRVEDGTVRVSFDVENTSAREGRCVIATYWPTTVADDDESTILTQRLSAGERWTSAVEVSTRFAARDDGRVTATVDGCVEGATTVALPAASATE